MHQLTPDLNQNLKPTTYTILEAAPAAREAHCTTLQHVVVCCSVWQCVAVCCSVLQCVAVCCNNGSFIWYFQIHTAAAPHCNMRQCDIVRTGALQCVAEMINSSAAPKSKLLLPNSQISDQEVFPKWQIHMNLLVQLPNSRYGVLQCVAKMTNSCGKFVILEAALAVTNFVFLTHSWLCTRIKSWICPK